MKQVFNSYTSIPTPHRRVQSRRQGAYQSPESSVSACPTMDEIYFPVGFSNSFKTVAGTFLLSLLTALCILSTYKLLFSSETFSVMEEAEFNPTAYSIRNSSRYHIYNNKFLFIRAEINRINPRADSAGLARAIIRESAQSGLDPLLITSIIFSESTFRQRALSNKGAVGFMQLLPSTAKYIARKQNVRWLGEHNLYSTDYNIRLGAQYMRYLQRMFRGDLHHALMAYNWGPGNVQKAIKGDKSVVLEVRNYADKILKRQRAMQSKFDSIFS